MVLEKLPVYVTLFLGVTVTLLTLGAVSGQNCRFVEDDGNHGEITEKQCLEGEISITVDFGDTKIDHVDFDTTCNTSEGNPVSIDSIHLDHNTEVSISITNDSASCKVTICYGVDIQGGLSPEYFIPERPVCNYDVECPPLDDPMFGEVTLSKNTAVFSIATYNCSPGYIFRDTSSRVCQISGNWSEPEPECIANNTAIEVSFNSSAQYVIVGDSVDLICAANGTPPLIIEFKNGKMESINQGITEQLEGNNSLNESVLSFKVLEPGPMNFTCVVTNSSGHEESSVLEVVGVVRRYIQICFTLPQDMLCSEIVSASSEVLKNISMGIQADCDGIVPDSLEIQNPASEPCNQSCQQQLFYNVTVLTANVTELNGTLHECINDSPMAAGIELVLNTECSPFLIATPSSPVCPDFDLITTSTKAVTSETPPLKPPLIESASPSDTSTSSPDGSGTNFIVIFIAVIVLLAAIVLLASILVIMMFLFHKRKQHIRDFPVDECDLEVFDPMQQFEQHAFQQNHIDNKAVNKSMEDTQTAKNSTANNSTANGRIP